MVNVHRLRSVDSGEEVVDLHLPPASVLPLGSARCALCGASLVGEQVSYHMVSPLVSMGSVTVCRRCRRAALSEGYRPAD